MLDVNRKFASEIGIYVKTIYTVFVCTKHRKYTGYLNVIKYYLNMD